MSLTSHRVITKQQEPFHDLLHKHESDEEEQVYIILLPRRYSSSSPPAAFDAARRALPVRGVGGKVNVLLAGGPDVETRDVDELRPDPDVPLLDEDAGVVDRLRQSLLVHLRLEAALEQLLSGELKDLVEFELVVGQEAVPAHPSQEGSTLEDPLGIVGLQRKEGPGCLPELGQRELDAPDLPLAPQSVFADQLELGIQPFLLVRTAGRLEGLAVCVNQNKVRGMSR